MNNWKVKHPRTDLSFEIAFTKAYREAKAKFTHPAQIELAALRAQFPAIMHEIEDEDLFAGRVQMGIVGFGSQHQTGGFGYYADLARIADLLANQPGNQKYREDIHDMLKHAGLKTEVIAASFKNSQQVLELAKYGLGASTIAPDVIEGLIKVDAAVLAVDAFTRDFEELCGEGNTMLNI